MIKKRILSVLICCVLMLGCVGCGSASEDTAKENHQIVSSDAATQSDEAEISREEEFFVSRTDERARTNTISAEMKEQAKQMEAASYQKLPDWYGTSPNGKYEFGWTCDGVKPYYEEVMVQEMAAEGFNFIRVPLDTRLFFAKDTSQGAGPHFRGNSDNANLKELENLDELISWCIQYGIHVCLDVHNTPGGYMIGGDEEASRELLFTEGSDEEQMFFDFWDMISARYADVSTNALSFNLYNEPPRFLEEEQYVRFVKRGIEVVHSYTSDRLIFVDMLDYAHVPVEGLVGEPVVQTFHFYEPTSFTHANFDLYAGINRTAPILVSYPILPISCALQDEDSYKISGDFPKDTKLVMYMAMGNIGGTFSIKADGEEIYTRDISRELIEEAGIGMTTDDYGTTVFNSYESETDPLRLECTLAEDAKQIEFCYRHENPVLIWLELNNLVVSTPNYRTALDAQWIDGVELPVTDAIIDENGRVTLRQDLSEYEQGYQLIEDTFQVYHEFSRRTGVQVMLQEFGAMYTNDVNCVADYFDDVLTVCDKYGFSWSMWNYDGGDFSYVVLDDIYRRRGATYEEVNPGRYVPLELRKVFQKHMQCLEK